MPRLFNYGSINLDFVYRLRQMPLLGETLAADSFFKNLGGKGYNHSVAAQNAGAQVSHLGAIGADDTQTLDALNRRGLAEHLQQVDQATGHAIILLAADGENSIVLHPGANQCNDVEQTAKQLNGLAQPGDWLLLQQEANDVPAIAKLGKQLGLNVAYAAAPFDADSVAQVLEHIDFLAVNQVEAAMLEQAFGKPVDQLGISHVLVTLGSKGAKLHDRATGQVIQQPAFALKVIDTTAAGDTFFGSLIGRISQGDDAAHALRYASAAAAIKVTRLGAAEQIPTRTEVQDFLKEQAT